MKWAFANGPPPHAPPATRNPGPARYSKRTVKVTREHNEECKRLLRLMGVPVLDAPSEAEAQCSSMVKAGLCYGIATEDMDSLTFGSSRVIRHLMATQSANLQVME